MKKKKAFFLICIFLFAFGITVLIAVMTKKEESSKEFICVTSFYPVYLLADSVAEGAEGVVVRNLTENHSGCIHDYTLTTQDMRLLSEARLFFVNGGGMELFLEKAAGDYENLSIIDTSEGFSFLEGAGHNHKHDHGETENEAGHDHDDTEEAGHEGDGYTPNAHIWLDIDGYLWQLSRVEEAFVAADASREALYRANAEKCREKLIAVRAEYEKARAELSGEEAVVFHEGFVYLLNMLGVETVHCLAMDSDTQISAGEAAEIIDECRLHGVTRMFAEAEYARLVTDTFAVETGGEVVVLNPITAGESGVTKGRDGVSIYCDSMLDNLEKIKQAYGLQ